DQVFLSWLAEDEAVRGHGAPQVPQALDLAAEREERDVAFDLGWPIVDPEWLDPARAGCARGVDGFREHHGPGIRNPPSECGLAVLVRDVLADRMPLVAVDPSFPLLHVDRVRGKVPVHHRMAVLVEIEPFLTDRGRCEHE